MLSLARAPLFVPRLTVSYNCLLGRTVSPIADRAVGRQAASRCATTTSSCKELDRFHLGALHLVAAEPDLLSDLQPVVRRLSDAATSPCQGDILARRRRFTSAHANW